MVKLQLACLAIILFVALIYFSIKRVNTYSHKIFSLSLIISGIYMLFDIASVYTVNNLDTVHPIVNRMVHNGFMACVLIEIFVCFMYTTTLIYDDENILRRKNRKWRVPIGIALVALMFAPLHYVETPKGNYSWGAAAIVTYSTIVAYCIMIGIELSLHWKEINKYKRRSVLLAYGIQMLVTIYQAMVPTALISSFGIAMINVSFFLTVESPDVHIIEQLKSEKDRADNANAAKTRFLSNVSHEIRTPLNAIVGLTEVLLRKELQEDEKKHLINIQSSTNVLLNLVNELLDFSKIEAGRFVITENVYQIEKSLHDLYMLGVARIADKDIELLMDIDKDTPRQLYGDVFRINQILTNILTNAIKYTERGKITLTVKVLEREDTRVKLYMAVEDTGQGITPEDMTKLFDAFTQVDVKKNQGKEGTGLGLTISSQLVELMGGKLNVTSEYGKGSKFYFELWQEIKSDDVIGDFDPAERNDIDNEDLVYKNTFIAPKAQVLIVDDNEINQIVVQSVLEPLQMQLYTAENGQIAVDMVKQKKYDLVIMDHYMPVMDGIEATIEIRKLKDEYYQKLPIMALTADAIAGSEHIFFEAGMSDFMTKPIDMKKLCEKLQKLLPKEYIEKCE